MNMPDITQAQIMQGIQWVGSQSVSMGAISQPREQILLSISSTVLAVGHILADAFLRSRRAFAQAQIEWAKTSQVVRVPPAPVAVAPPPAVPPTVPAA